MRRNFGSCIGERIYGRICQETLNVRFGKFACHVAMILQAITRMVLKYREALILR